MISGIVNRDVLPFLQDSVKRLNKAEVDFIVIPCNTAHIFIEELREVSAVPVLSIIDETAVVLEKRGLRKVGLLATSGTVNSGIHVKGMGEHGILVITPGKLEQSSISKIILKILDGTVVQDDKDKLIRIGGLMLANGAETILLACTDLQSIIQKGDLQGKTTDTLEILTDSAFVLMTKG